MLIESYDPLNLPPPPQVSSTSAAARGLDGVYAHTHIKALRPLGIVVRDCQFTGEAYRDAGANVDSIEAIWVEVESAKKQNEKAMESLIIAGSSFDHDGPVLTLLRGELPPTLEIRGNDFTRMPNVRRPMIFVNNQKGVTVTFDRNSFPSEPFSLTAVIIDCSMQRFSVKI
jgi:hypothetical protein